MENSDVWVPLLQGFSRIMDLKLLLMCFVGTSVGTLIGVLPGIGPAAAVAVLLPVTYGSDPLTALVMLAGIYYGAMYGGTITSVLINVPGETASVVTTFEGYPMAKAGLGGVALGISAIGSFFAGTVGLVMLSLIAVPLARAALKFGPPEYFAVMLLTFTMVAALGGGGLTKSLLSLFLGLLFATVGQDIVSGYDRLTYGVSSLIDGIKFIPVIVGMFGLTEVVYELIHPSEFIGGDKDTKLELRSIFPKIHHVKESLASIVRGGIIGFFVGVLPGAGAVTASFLSYGLEKKVSKNPEKFGTGVIQGIAGPESANNGASSGSFVPLLALGIPGSTTTAVLLGAFIILGVQPGPRLFTDHPHVVWGLIASMYVGNFMLLVLNTAFIPVFVWLLKISQRSLSVIVAVLCFVGVYSMNNSMPDVWMMLIFTLFGFAFKLCSIPPSPLIIALVLGQSAEFALRQSLVISMGSPAIFFTRPICIALICASAFSLLIPFIMKSRGSKTEKTNQ